jgi:hypothetical protein
LLKRLAKADKPLLFALELMMLMMVLPDDSENAKKQMLEPDSF